MQKGYERYAPLLGVLGIALWIVGIIILSSGEPDDKAPPAAIAAYFDDKSGRILISTIIFGVGTAAVIWFLGTVSSRLRQAGAASSLTSVVMAAGTAMATAITLAPAAQSAGALAFDNGERGLSPSAAEALLQIADGFFFTSELVAIAFAGAAAVAILRSRLFPAWFGWFSALVAIGLIIGPIGWLFLIFGIPLWLLFASIWLAARPAPAAAPQPPM